MGFGSAFRYILLFLGIFLVIDTETASTRHGGQLVKLHPIDEAQYKHILQLTQSSPVISEARLITGRSNSDDSRTLSADESPQSNFLHLLRLVGLSGGGSEGSTGHSAVNSGSKVSGTPLCVIKVADLDNIEQPGNGERALGRAADGDAPVNCVVMVKGKPDEAADNEKRVANSYYDQSQYPNYPYYWYNPYEKGRREFADPTNTNTKIRKGAAPSSSSSSSKRKSGQHTYDQDYLRALQVFHQQAALGAIPPPPFPYPFSPRYAYPFYPPPPPPPPITVAATDKISSKGITSTELAYGQPVFYDPYAAAYSIKARTRHSKIPAESDEDIAEDYVN